MPTQQRIMVLGSNSFSGGDFVDLLLEDPQNHVIGVSRWVERDDLFLPYHRHSSLNFKFYQYDLNYDLEPLKDLIDQFKPEYIVNFAAQSEVGPSWMTPWHWFETNTVALSRLIDFLKDKKYLKRYVHISSPEVYGSCEGIVKENAPLNPSTPYAASKAAADLLLSAYYKNFGFPLVTIRATNVYGVGQQLFKIIPRSIIAFKSNKKIGLHSGGKMVKSYIHIRDVSHGELAAMIMGKPGEIYHLSPDQGISVRDLVKLVATQMKIDFAANTFRQEARLGEDRAYVIDSSKARSEFSWLPKVSLTAGVNQVIAWVDQNWDRIQCLPLEYVHRA